MSEQTAQMIEIREYHQTSPVMALQTYQEVQKPRLQKIDIVPISTLQTLEKMFPEQELQDKNIKQAKAALGALAFEFNPEQLNDLITEVQFLTESWLDDFERQIFKGITLQELLHEKGGK